MKARLVLAAAVATCFSALASAQMGPGMMGGAGPGRDQPGMMGAPGTGPGMMGGQAGCPTGPGMMGGHGMGHGMGSMGAGMGGYGMGPGMMGEHGMIGAHHAALERLNLKEEQRTKVREVQRDLQRKQYALMGSMRDLRWQAEDNARTAEFDETAARKQFDAMAAIHKQMFEAHLDAHKRIEAILTKEQREQLRKGPRPG